MKLLISTLLCATFLMSYGQWVNGIGTIYPEAIDARVGIGNISPNTLLHIKSNSYQYPWATPLKIEAAQNTRSLNINHNGSAGVVWVGDVAMSNGNWSPLHLMTGGATTMALSVSNNVGIGITNPTARLHINSSSSSIVKYQRTGSDIFSHQISGESFGLYNETKSQYAWRTNGAHLYLNEANGGNVGIGTSSPTAKLHINSPTSMYACKFSSQGWTYGFNVSFAGFGLYDYNINQNVFSTYYQNLILLEKAGSTLGIGTRSMDSNFKVNVNGKILAEEIKIIVDVPADYVFDPSYKKMSLGEVATYIKQNRHLPNVPSADELKKDGWYVGEMSNKLLEKVEEITLYLIELKQENDELKAINDRLIKRIEALESTIK